MTCDTFREAMRMADVALRPGFKIERPTGHFRVSETGREDQWGWIVTVGPADAMPTGPTHIVTKASGAVRPVASTDLARIEAAVKVSVRL